MQGKVDYNKMTFDRKLTGMYAVLREKSENCLGLIKNVRIESQRGTSRK